MTKRELIEQHLKILIKMNRKPMYMTMWNCDKKIQKWQMLPTTFLSFIHINKIMTYDESYTLTIEEQEKLLKEMNND